MTNFSNSLTKCLGIEFPILLAPMAGGPTTPQLITAVSNAGGLGQFGAAYLNEDAIVTMANQLRASTNKSFGINLFLPQNPKYTDQEFSKATEALTDYFSKFGLKLPKNIIDTTPSFNQQLKAVIESEIKFCSFHLGLPTKNNIQELKEAGISTAASATSVEEGKQAEERGVDFIIAQGSEAGGHRGTWMGDWRHSMTGTLSLLAQLKAHLSTPIIAAGGIMNGAGIAATMALGAVGVQMGTAFLTCPEAGVNDNYKKALLNTSHDNTIVTRTFSGRPARGLRNYYIEQMENSGSYALPFPLQNILTGPLRKAAAKENNTDYMSMWCGQGASLSRGIPAAKLIETLVDEYNQTLITIAN